MYLYILMQDWQELERIGGAILKATVKKSEHSRMTRQPNVMIYSVASCYENEGKYYIIEPSRERGYLDRINEGPFYDTIEDAKPDAKKMLIAYLEKIKLGKINWWTGRKQE